MHHTDDRYAILQVDAAAEPEVVEAAYKRLAQKYHPDVNADPDATAIMQRLNEAYEVLSDPKKRSAYDRQRRREAPQAQQQRQARTGPSNPESALTTSGSGPNGLPAGHGGVWAEGLPVNAAPAAPELREMLSEDAVSRNTSWRVFRSPPDPRLGRRCGRGSIPRPGICPV